MLYIETLGGAMSTTEDGSSHTDDGEEQDEPLGDVSILLKTTKVTDTSIYLDWSTYRPPYSVLYYRVIWSSAAQPMVSYNANFHRFFRVSYLLSKQIYF